ncbi:MAG: adenylate/guanylate cyclase domain-containing protein [Desulfamplus sp.]|nr:adenylate/guanylate cyclase domain-containing protein [Desulfamplus sp.]
MKRLKSVIIPLFIPISVFIFWTHSSFLELADFAWRDVLYTIRASIVESFEGGKPEVDDVVIVAIDAPSFQQLNLRWPWPRTLHAQLVDILSSAGASAIAFDILFPEKSKDESEDSIFAESIKKAGNVVLAANLTITGRQGYETYFTEEPVKILASAAANIGMVNFYPDGDGSIRMASNYVDTRPSIALAAAATALNQETTDAEDYLFFIDYAGKAGTVPAFSYYQVLNKMVAPEVFKDKVVFIGFIADSAVEVESGADAYPYPFMRFTKKMMFGVEIQANVVRTLFSGYPIQEFPFPELTWAIFYICAIFLTIFRRNPVSFHIIAIVIMVLIPLVAIALFTYQGVVVDVMPGLAAIFLNGTFMGLKEFTQNYKEKSVLKKAFDSYVSPDVVASVIANHESLKLGGERKRLSVLFSDIRGFTTLSEKLTPEELVSLLNDYFTRMTDTIFKHKGTLDKYIGDAIMVIFGAPVWSDNHAENSCYTALEMKERLEEMNIEKTAENRDLNRSPLSLAIGIGINTGEMIVGNMGSLRRFDYTVMGDEVNLASRLEGVTKSYGVQIIISEETKNDLNLNNFLCRELDLIRVKGKYKAIKIYELVSTRPALNSQEACVELFVQGVETYREAYKDNSWDKAIALFRKALEYNPSDAPSKLFIERCEMFKKNPPVAQGEEWDGVWVMTSK